jgi:hypothetical protein
MTILSKFRMAMFLFALIQTGVAGVVTGSFYIVDGINNFPAFFEARKGDQGEFLMGYLLWDNLYSLSRAAFTGDGKVGVVEVTTTSTDGTAQKISFDLEQEKVLLPFGDGPDLADVTQNVGTDDPAEPVELRIKRGANVQLSWSAIGEHAYSIEGTSDLTKSWAIKASVSPGVGEVTWEATPGESAGFYRVSGGIKINGVALTLAQISELEQRYGVKPRAGEYWYDSTSGLYGAVGYSSYGFMLAGHDFGPLQRQSSLRNTGVLVNGRELTVSEWWVWSLIVGSWIPSGSYWLDAKGNAGTGDQPSVASSLGNLYDKAKQGGYTGTGGSGDNFWSTRFSAGNYDPNQGVGYVSVPGYGPVDFGF